MKTMMSVDGKKILRVTEDKARELYMEGFRFVPKSMWKEQVRDVNLKPAINEETGKLELTKKKNNEMRELLKNEAKLNLFNDNKALKEIENFLITSYENLKN